MGNIYLGSNHINFKVSNTVKLKEEFLLLSEDGPINLDVEIIADFESVPQKYHEVFMNMLTAKYYNKVSFGDNPFSECRPVVKRKWWQFWKSEWFTK